MIPDIITCISFFQLFLITLFNPLKVNYKANRWFALFFLSAGLLMVNSLILQQNAQFRYHYLLVFTELARLAIAPALYFVVCYYTFPNRTFRLKDYIHFIPVFLLFVLTVPFWKTADNSFQSYQDMLSVNLKQWLPLCLFVLLIAQMCYSLMRAVVVLVRHQKNIELINANINAISLNWLKHLVYIVSSILILWYAGIFFSFNWIEQYRPIVVLGMVLYLGYYVIAQKEIYPFEVSKLREIDELLIGEQEQIATPRFTTEIMLSYKTRLIQIMETERVYLQNDITLPQLADIMEISSHDLSYVINNGFNMTFFKFINSYRIAEAKKLLMSEDLKQFNIIGIAYNSGFNSKSTFNSAFKKETGLSPTQFINKSKQGLITPVHS